ncbi:hypothetical protein B566_EDAN004956 [Ephemera danica]|nr:hypothetical protein B566_EDAN004956 [Ephemera danica]
MKSAVCVLFLARWDLILANDFTNIKLEKIDPHLLLTQTNEEEVDISNYILLAIGLMAVALLAVICACLRYHGRNRAKTLQSRFTSFSYSTRSTQDELSNMNEPSPTLSRRNMSRENSRGDLKNNKMFNI